MRTQVPQGIEIPKIPKIHKFWKIHKSDTFPPKGRLMTPIVQIDTREQRPLIVTAYPTEVVTLPVGDYGITGFSDWENPRFIVERKTLGDLIGSMTHDRARFMREVEKLRQFQFRALLIEATESEVSGRQYRSAVPPASILGTLAALQVRTCLHVIWGGDATGAARYLERLVRQFVRGIEKDHRRLNTTAA